MGYCWKCHLTLLSQIIVTVSKQFVTGSCFGVVSWIEYETNECPNEQSLHGHNSSLGFIETVYRR